MFQWDVIDTSPDLGCQNVLKTFEMAIWHNRRTTRTELEFSVAGFIFAYVPKYFSGPVTGGDRPDPCMDPPLRVIIWNLLPHSRRHACTIRHSHANDNTPTTHHFPRISRLQQGPFCLWPRSYYSQSYYRAMLCIRGASHAPVSVRLSVRHKSVFY